jgi:type IV pilus assembly protein PilP
MIFSAFRRTLPGLLPMLMLVGCSDSGMQDVRQWMENTKRQTRVSIPKLSEPKKFEPYTYSGKDSPDPFNPEKLASAYAKLNQNSGSDIRPDLDRRREPLEAYPLDVIRMVGTLQKSGMSYAILMVDNAVFQVKVGNHIGQNFGLITRITENSVELREIVQDAAGDWVERTTTLELQEATQ